MTEILNQDEINALLTAITKGDSETSHGHDRRIKIAKTYDFRRPDKFAGDHIRTIQMMHETFARLTTAMLSSRLRMPVSMHVCSVDQLTYDEFIRSLPCPTTLGVLDLFPLNGPAVLEISPGLTFSIIDRLFGGRGGGMDLHRELTDIELLIMDRILSATAENLMVSWNSVISLKPVLSCIETVPQFAQIVPPNDICVLVTFEMKIGDTEGISTLCIPYITLEPVIEKLSAGCRYSLSGGEKNEAVAGRLDKAVYTRYICFPQAADPMLPEMIRKLKPGMKIQLNAHGNARPGYEFSGTGKGGLI